MKQTKSLVRNELWLLTAFHLHKGASLFGRHRSRESSKDCSGPEAIRRAASSALSKITEIDEDQQATPKQFVGSHVDVHHLPSVKPLQTGRGKSSRAKQMSSCSTKTTAPNMELLPNAEDARALFEEYGINRPPG